MNTRNREPTPKQLEKLVRELIQAGALTGSVTTSRGRRTKGLAFLFRDMRAPEVKKLLGRVDLTLPLSTDLFKTLSAVREIFRENRHLRELSVRDTLTGLFNIRHFEERLQIELERVRRSEKPCSLLMIDLDNFKGVNDSLGHLAGDDLLRDAADIIQNSVRAVDVPVRYGGDEFAVILPDTGTRSASRLAERIRSQIESDPRTAEFGVTASFGLATHQHFDQEDLKDVVDRADKALYEAKGEGGNRVWWFEADRRKEAPTGVTVEERHSLYFKLAEE